MKCFRILIAALMAVLFVPARAPVHARAESYTYAVAPDTNVWFYTSEEESSKLFLLPETYYVRVLMQGDVYSAVEYLVNDPPYKKVMGYCRTASLVFVDFIPVRPYLKELVTVSYRLPGSEGSLGGEFSSIEKTFVYYGSRYDAGMLYFYVLSGEEFGYIPAEEPLSFEKNDDWVVSETPPEPSDPPADSFSPAHIAALCVAAAASVVIIVLAVRGKRRTEQERDP